MYKIAICDDVSIDSDNIVEIIKRKAIDNNIFGISYFLYNNGAELLKNINEKFDVIFLDIKMEKMNGNEAAGLIRIKDLDVILVFCSAIRMPTPDMFKVQPYRYITKQFVKNEMELEIKEVLDKMISSSQKYFLTFRNGKGYRINLNDILYIALIKRGCAIHVLSKSFHKYGCGKIYCDESLKRVYELIDDDRFVYAHNSYVINIEHIIKGNKTEVILNDNISLTVARSKEEDLKKRMIEYFGNKYIRKSYKV